jgi:hypothetical protein
MSNFILARPLTTVIVTTVLTTGISVSAYAHGMGNHTGGGGTPMAAVTTTKTVDHHHWRYLDFVGPGYTGQSYGCFYKHTGRGLVRICPDLN